jgi:hypothetical protein
VTVYSDSGLLRSGEWGTRRDESDIRDGDHGDSTGPMTPPSIEDAIRLQRKIRDALLAEWDPIGVSGFPEAKNEYDGYVGVLFQVLVSGGTEDDVFRLLWEIETETMGLTGDQEATRRFAKRLVAFTNESSEKAPRS